MEFLAMFLWGLSVALIAYLWTASNAFKYCAKFLFYYLLMTITGFLVVVIGGPLKGRDVNNLRYVADSWNVILPVLGVTPIVRDEHNLKSDQPYVLISNHQSSFDLMGFMRILPNRCSSLLKKQLLYAGTFGLGSWMCELVFIDRQNRDSAVSTMTTTAKVLLEKNLKIWIFPEGTRNLKKGMLPFKKGAFHLAIEAQIPIVPVVFSSYEHFMSKKPMIFNSGRFIITCLPPISTKGMTKEDCVPLLEKVQAQMLDVYYKTTLEIQDAEKAAGRTLIKEY